MFKLNIDLSQVLDFNKLQKKVEELASKYTKEITQSVYEKTVGLAGDRLNTRLEKYIQALNVKNEVVAGKPVGSVVLDEAALWIDQGQKAFNQRESLLAKGVEVGRDGSRYKIIPFEHVSGGTPAQSSLYATIQAEARRRKAAGTMNPRPERKIVDQFNVHDSPVSTEKLKIGAGPVGQVAQGRASGRPILQGVKIYQDRKKGKKSRMTFRVVSDNSDPNAWEHPGNPATNIMDDAAKWAEKEVDTYLEKLVKEI